MFTGLVQTTGTVAALGGGRLSIRLDPAPQKRGLTPFSRLAEGDSVAVNGVCLTATAVNGGGFDADVMPETLRRTALGELGEGDAVNVEPALRAGDPLGGHMVQGHVDGTGTVESVTEEGFARVVRIACEPSLLRYVVEKGSIAVDGVSLTVVAVDDGGFSVSLIPETLERTTLGAAERGRVVNLEVDVLAKYVEKLVAAR